MLPLEESSTFDRKVHKAVKVSDTDDPDADHRISQVLKRGFQRADKQLRAEEVVILRYRGDKE